MAKRGSPPKTNLPLLFSSKKSKSKGATRRTSQLASLFKRRERGSAAQQATVQVAMSERIARERENETKVEVSRDVTLTEYQRGRYKFFIYTVNARQSRGRAGVKDFLAENAQKGDRTWVNVTVKGKSTGTPVDTAEATYQRVDTFLTARYVSLSTMTMISRSTKETWEAVIIRKV